MAAGALRPLHPRGLRARPGRPLLSSRALVSSESGIRAALPLIATGFVVDFVVVGGGIDTVSVFLNVLTTENGWSHSSLSVAIGAGAMTAGLATPGVGALIDRYGLRVPMTLGAALLAAGYLNLVWMSEPWHFMAANLLLGPGFACELLPITVAITLRVTERPAFALGLMGVGSSMGALVLAPALQALIEAWGWRVAYLVLGALIVLLPLALLWFALPRGRLDPGSASPLGSPSTSDLGGPTSLAHIDLRRELRRPGLLPLAAILVLPEIANFGLQVHMVPYLSRAGHGAGLAALALGGAIGMSGIGKVAGGLAGDRFGTLRVLRIALLSQALGFGLLALAAARIPLGLFVIIHGLASGMEVAVVPVIALSVLGKERFGTLYGLLQLVATLAMGIAAIVPGVLVDATGSYSIALGFWVGLVLLAAGVSLWMGSDRLRVG